MRAFFLPMVALTALGCGGKVLVDEPPSGAGGSTSSSTVASTVGPGPGSTTGPTGSTATTGTDCATLQENMLATLTAAMACDPYGSSLQCAGAAKSFDICGCPAIVNQLTPDLASGAQAAYQAWTSAGCGPADCDAPCFDTSVGVCEPVGGNTIGQCSPAVFKPR